jgi:hypothetical protein
LPIVLNSPTNACFVSPVRTLSILSYFLFGLLMNILRFLYFSYLFCQVCNRCLIIITIMGNDSKTPIHLLSSGVRNGFLIPDTRCCLYIVQSEGFIFHARINFVIEVVLMSQGSLLFRLQAAFPNFLRSLLMIWFANTTFHTTKCCLVCSMPIVKPLLTHLITDRTYVPFTRSGNRVHSGTWPVDRGCLLGACSLLWCI